MRELSNNEFRVKLTAESHIDELSKISKAVKGKDGNPKVVSDTKNQSFAKDGFTYHTVYFKDFDGVYYRETLSVVENDGISTVYNVGKIKADSIPDGNIVSTIGSKADMLSADVIIPETSEEIKGKVQKSAGEVDPFAEYNYFENRKTYGESLIDSLERTVQTHEDKVIINDYRQYDIIALEKAGLICGA